MRLLFATIAVVAMFALPDRLRAADDPLAYVPANASVFIHVRAGDLWNTSLLQDVRKAAGKDLDAYLDETKAKIGLGLDSIDTLTFCYPNLPRNSRDETKFLMIVTTKTPYDKDGLLKQLRNKDAVVKDDRVALQQNLVLQFAGQTMFLVMHDSLVEKFAKAPKPDANPGPMADAIKLAREKNHLVLSVDFSKLPSEILTDGSPELQALAPLLKSKADVLFANVNEKEKQLKFGMYFVDTGPRAVQDAEQRLKLLRKLAGDGLASLRKDKEFQKEFASLMPVFEELDRAVKDIKVTNRLEADLALNTNLPIAQTIVKSVAKIREASAAAESLNNLKQLTLGMYGFHDANGGLPAAAICSNNGKPLLSWRVAILPFIDEVNLFNQFKIDEPWDSENNKPLIDKMPKAYLVPGTKSEGKTHYRLFYGNGAVFDLNQQVSFNQITDGLSNTAMIVETADAVPWTKPDDIAYDPKAPIEKLMRFSNDKTNVALCDGSVRALKRGLGDKTWRLFIEKADGIAPPDLDAVQIIANDPLAYIPANASVLIHLRAGDLWNTSLLQEVRKAMGKDFDAYLEEPKKEIGLAVDSIDTATFCFPNMPQGPGDEQTFVVIVTTKTPYDRDALLKPLRKKDAVVNDNRVRLQGNFVLQFSSDTMFLVMHDSLLEKFGQAQTPDAAPGVMTDALKLAREKNQFVLSVDFSKLPDEILTAELAELQPFMPLLKAKAFTLSANVKEKEKQFKVGLRFVNTDATAAQDAEQSFKLLMKLAADGLARLQKEEGILSKTILPAFKELERAVKDIKITRDGTRLEAALALDSNLPIGQMVVESLAKAKERAAVVRAQNNLKQIGLAMHNYHDLNNGLPPAAICDKKGKPLLSWRVAILPLIEQNDLYMQFKLDEPWDSENNKKLIDKMPTVYLIPGTKSEGKTHYRVFHGNGALFDLIQQTPFQSVTDGLSNTLMVVETADAVPWTKPDDIEFDPKASIEKLLRFSNDVTNVLFCDGSVRSLKRGLGDKTWRALITKAGGEEIPDLDK
jgi:prepilin-type processing-associated H-X9-DG protein